MGWRIVASTIQLRRYTGWSWAGSGSSTGWSSSPMGLPVRSTILCGPRWYVLALTSPQHEPRCVQSSSPPLMAYNRLKCWTTSSSLASSGSPRTATA